MTAPIHLLNTLKDELAAVERFIGILQQEQTALVNADIDNLLSISDTKIKHSDTIRLLMQQRSHLLHEAGFPTDRTGMESWISTLAGEERKLAEKIWGDLINAGLTAQRLNATNGKLIDTHLQHNQQALSALSGAANHANVYGRDGQPYAAVASLSRTFGKV